MPPMSPREPELDPPSWRAAGARSSGSGAALEEPEAAPIIPAGFRGKVAMVTGGATGLGRTTAIEFGKLGCNVAFCFVDRPGGDVRETALLTETTLSAMGVGVYAELGVLPQASDAGFVWLAEGRAGLYISFD